MIVTTHRILYKYGDTIKIKPIADIHFGASACDVNALKKDLANLDDNTWLIGIGDLMDSVSITDPRYSKGNDATAGSAIIDEQVDGMENLLQPYKDRIIGLGRGNHEDVIIKHNGTDPMKRLCQRLDCKYLGYSGLLRLLFRQKAGGGRKVVIRYHHGWGGSSRTQGADLTKYSKDIKHWEADVFLYGHVHRRQSDRIPRIGLVGEQMVAKPKLVGICGTYLRTYLKTTSSTYSEIKGYPPTEIGGIMLEIKPRDQWVDMRIIV